MTVNVKTSDTPPYQKTASLISSSRTPHQLHHRFYDPVQPPIASVLILHGMAEHSGRYHRFAEFLAANGVAVATYDHLGHGRTVNHAKELGFFSTDYPMQGLLEDAIRMANALKARHPDARPFIMGHSMGSFITRVLIAHHFSDFAGAILMGSADTAPAAAWFKPALHLANTLAPKQHNPTLATSINALLNAKLAEPAHHLHAWISESLDNLHTYDADPLCGFEFTNNGYATLLQLMQRGLNPHWADPMARNFALLFVSGQNDPVGDMGQGIVRVTQRLQRQGFTNVRRYLYPNMRHEVLHERHATMVQADILAWLLAQSVPVAPSPS